jgi:ABC-type glutathione transport system ATPase component
MAKYRCLAAAKLVELTASEKAETARKACLDIIRQPKIATEAERGEEDGNKQAKQLSGAQASRILAAMVEENPPEADKILK